MLWGIRRRGRGMRSLGVVRFSFLFFLFFFFFFLISLFYKTKKLTPNNLVTPTPTTTGTGYPECKLEFLNIDNIHVIRKCHTTLQTIMQDRF